MPTYQVVPYRVWQHPDGRRASIHGSYPGEGWSIVRAGWTVENTRTGCTGIGRKPWETEVEANAWAMAENMRLEAIRQSVKEGE